MGTTGKTDVAARSAWRVDFDTETCSLCEMCVNHCPDHALFVRREGEVEQILFDYRLCDGCSGERYCEAHCPEKAVTVSRVPPESMAAEPILLVRGEMADCKACGSLFMPERKLQALLSKQKITPKSVQSYCPGCRRDHLLDSYLSITGQR